MAFKLLSRDTRGRVEARQLLVPEEVNQTVTEQRMTGVLEEGMSSRL